MNNNSKREYKNLKDYLSPKYVIQRKIFKRLQRCKTLVRLMVRGEETGALIHDPFFSMEVTTKLPIQMKIFEYVLRCKKNKLGYEKSKFL